MKTPSQHTQTLVDRIRAKPVTSAFLILTATAFIVLAAFGWAISTTRDLAEQNRGLTMQAAEAAEDGAEAHAALCVFKGDLGRRIAETQDFINHPPKTIIGVPVTDEVLAQAKTQLHNQTATFDSLSTLDC